MFIILYYIILYYIIRRAHVAQCARPSWLAYGDGQRNWQTTRQTRWKHNAPAAAGI